jgi:myo-inositol-1-phosphate synthase
MSREIRVALAGIGNCSSSLVQGVQYYKRNDSKTPGLIHSRIGGYSLNQIRFVAAFDIDKRKVGKDLSEAIFAEPNNVRKIADTPSLGVRVQMAQPLDGISTVAGEKILLSDSKASNVRKVLEESSADILVNLTPTGAAKASEMFAEAAWQSHCSFINATPAQIASKTKWQSTYRKSGLALVGDDVMDQVGSTILHKNVLSLLVDRGVHLDETYQLDIGGGTESQMALDKKRYEIKRNIKTAAVAAVVPYRFPIVAGSSDFVDFMENRRTSYFWIRGEYFAGTEFTMDIRLSLEDGPACAGILSDVIRMAKVAVDKKMAGYLPAISSYGFKAPAKKIPDLELRKGLETLGITTKSN